MDTALTVLAFLGIGLLVDTWLGTRPVFTIGLVVFAAVGTFVRMKLVYDATMSRLESERRESARRAA
ncbi:MAG: AtpZ/AtpI family protein [Ilumatobacteraceae bacterium]|nr:AtpZ/AtpI family protein [Actinomycetota bacterium]